MICPKCGNVMDDSETSCKNCGVKVKENIINEDNIEDEPEHAVVAEQQVVKEQVVKQEVQSTAFQQPATTVQQQVPNQVKSDDLQKQIQNSKNNNGLLLTLVIGLIALISTVGGIVLCKKLSSIETVSVKESAKDVGDSSKKVEGSSDVEESNSKSDNKSSTEDEEETEDTTATDVSIGTYVFTFPSNYESKINSGMGISVDKTNKVQVVYTAMGNVSYENAIAAKEEYKAYLIQNGFAVSTYNEYTYSGREWLVYSGILSNMNSMYAITKLGDNGTFQSTIFNLGSKTNDELFSELDYVLDNVKTTNSNADSGSNNQVTTGGSSESVSA